MVVPVHLDGVELVNIFKDLYFRGSYLTLKNHENKNPRTFPVIHMLWNQSAVTIKRLHHESQPGGYIDLLITEMANMGKIRHQNILLLMGVCQTNSLDNMVLVFERVGLGSLYYYLHQRLERLPTQNIRDILLQICSALVFMHHQNFIHCGLSSHAINLVNPYLAKIGNLEYMLENSKAEMGKQSNVSSNVSQNSLYNWMAPELMLDKPPSQASDVYSYACIIWEMFENEVPWDMCDSEFIKHKLTGEKVSLRMTNSKIPQPFKSITEYGLHLEIYDRDITFEQINQWICAPPEQQDAIPGKPSTSSPQTRKPVVSVSPEDFHSDLSTNSALTPKSQVTKSSADSKNRTCPRAVVIDVDNVGNTPISRKGTASRLKGRKSPRNSPKSQRYGSTRSPASIPKTRQITSEFSRNSKKSPKQFNENHNYGPWDMHDQWIVSYPAERWAVTSSPPVLKTLSDGTEVDE